MSAVLIHAAAAAAVVVAIALLTGFRIAGPAAGRVLLVSGPRRWRVVRQRTLLVSPYNRAVEVSVEPVTLEVVRRGADAFRSRDGSSIDLLVRVTVRVNHGDDDILAAARTIGADATADPRALESLLAPAAIDAVATVISGLELDEVSAQLDEVADRALEVLGRDLNGFVCEKLEVEPPPREGGHSQGPFR